MEKTGRIRIHHKGFGFIIDEEHQEYFVPKPLRNNSIHNDQVTFEVVEESTSGNPVAKVIKVLAHDNDFLIASLQSQYNKLKLVAHNNKIKEELFFKKYWELKKNHNYLFKIKEVVKNRIYLSLVKDLGHVEEKFVDLKSIYSLFEVKDEFSDDVIEESVKIANEISQEERNKRVDLTNKTIITIDGEDAKDLDDAIRVEKLENNNFLLGVYIADVAHYVKEGLAIDHEAFLRGTSIYLPGMVIPMLPENLSNNLCSLLPNEEKLVMACEMEIDNEGKVIEAKVFEAIIKTTYRATYDEINLFLKDQIPLKNENIKDLIKNANILSLILQKNKTKEGMMEFAIDEPKFILDEKGKVKDIKVKRQDLAERLIESFMVLANEEVSKLINKTKLISIYRIHGEPHLEKVEEFYKIIKKFNKHFEAKNHNITPLDLQKIIDIFKNEPYFESVIMLILKAMDKARYSSKNIGHFGLVSKNYSHFTSPIRRYPDLILHRLIKNYLINSNLEYGNKIKAKMEKMCEHLSEREVIAVSCERKCNGFKKTEWAKSYEGKEFLGKVMTLTKFGMFIKIPNSVEGFLSYRDIFDDQYNLEEYSPFVKGQNTKRKFTLGDEVKIFIKSSDLQSHKINFGLVEFKKQTMESWQEFQKNLIK